MNLLTNEKWASQAKKYFAIKDNVELGSNNYELDYTFKDDFGNIIAYGYNIEREDATEKEMYEEFFYNTDSNVDNFTKAIFTEKIPDLNPILFFVKKAIIYHTGIGIVHHMLPRFISTKDISPLLELLIKNKEDSEKKIRLYLLESEEDENYITIEELKNKGANNEQIKKITEEPLWCEQDIPTKISEEHENNKPKFKQFKKKASRLCIYFDHNNELVIKARISESTQIYGSDLEEASHYFETNYWIISQDGNHQEIPPLTNHKYQLLKK